MCDKGNICDRRFPHYLPSSIVDYNVRRYEKVRGVISPPHCHYSLLSLKTALQGMVSATQNYDFHVPTCLQQIFYHFRDPPKTQLPCAAQGDLVFQQDFKLSTH